MKKKNGINRFILLLGIIISGVILYIGNDEQVGLHVLSMLTLTIFSMISVKFDLWHPYMWYSFFFFLYSSSYSIMYILNGYAVKGYSKEIIIFQWFALVTFLLVVGIKNVKYTSTTSDVTKITKNNHAQVVTIFEIILVILSLIASYYALHNGYSSKSNMYASGNFVINTASRGTLILNIIYLYHQMKFYFNNNKLNKSIAIIVGFTVVLFSLSTGERDRMIIFFVENIYLLYYIGKISKKHFICFLPILLFSIPLLTMFKYTFMTGIVNNSVQIFSLNTLLKSFFSDEFYTVGRNLMLLYNNKSFTMGYFAGKSILNDFIRIFFDTSYSNGSWFSQNVAYTTGYGFTIVGEGYVNFGFFGIILVMIICGFIVRLIYKNSNKNIYRLIIYIYMIPITIYSIRADLANILSPLILHTSVAMIIIFLNEKIKFKNNKTERNDLYE